MTKTVHVLFVCVLFVACSLAQTPVMAVLPWNNHPAAVSLSFDDSRPIQLELAAPELKKRHLRATFFVTVSKLARLNDWKQVAAEGHEIGNHTISHEHPAALTREGEELQVEDAKNFLDSNFHTDVITFAYPYMEISPGLLFWVKKYNFAARGWPQDQNLLYVRPGVDPDWYNLPGQPTFTKYGLDVYQGWVEKALSLNAWTTFQFHGIGDPATGWEPIPITTFIALLDYLKSQQAKGLWIAPFGEVAAYFRAQRILENSKPQVRKSEERFSWILPVPFPRGVVLKVKFADASRLHAYQNGRELHFDKNGIFRISFDARELVVRGEF